MKEGIRAFSKRFFSFLDRYATLFLLLLVISMLGKFAIFNFKFIQTTGWVTWAIFWATWVNLSLFVSKLKWDKKYKLLSFVQFFFLLAYEIFILLPLSSSFLRLSNRIKIQDRVERNGYIIFGLAYLLIFALWSLNAYTWGIWDKIIIFGFNFFVLTLHGLVYSNLSWYYRLVYKPYAYFRVYFERLPAYSPKQWQPILEDIIRREDWDLICDLHSDFFHVHFSADKPSPTHTKELLNIFCQVCAAPQIPDYAKIPDYVVFKFLVFEDWAWWQSWVQKAQDEPTFLPFADHFMDIWVNQTERFLEYPNTHDTWFFRQPALENKIEDLLANTAPKLPDSFKERLEYVCSLTFVGIGVAQNLDLPTEIN